MQVVHWATEKKSIDEQSVEISFGIVMTVLTAFYIVKARHELFIK